MRLRLAVLLVLTIGPVGASPSDDPLSEGLARRWEGLIQDPRRPIVLRLTLERDGDGWTGEAVVPGAGSAPLDDLVVEPPRLEFVLPLGDPGLRFEGTLGPGVLAGVARQGDEEVPFRLEAEPDLGTPSTHGERWRADLEVARRKFLAYDRSFDAAARAGFEERLAQLSRDADERTDAQMMVGLARAVAAGGNAHTRLYLLRNRSMLRRWPIRVWWFGDELRVVRTTPDLSLALGCRVVTIAGRTPEDLRSEVGTLFAGNASWKAYKSTYFLTSPDALYGLSVLPDPTKATLAVACSDGMRHELALQPLPVEERRSPREAWWDLSLEHEEPGWLAPPVARPSPSLRRPDESYWVEPRPEDGLLYLSFSRTQPRPGQDLLSLVTSASDQSPDLDTLVLDLRWNTGGDNSVAKPLLRWIASSRFNAPGRLFVITGRATFSAGLYCAAWMVQNTEAKLVGEPAGDVLDYWSEGGNIELPFSGLTLHFANGFHGYSKHEWPGRQPFFEDLDVDDVTPEVATSMSFEDWMGGRDPALDAIVARRDRLLRGSAR